MVDQGGLIEVHHCVQYLSLKSVVFAVRHQEKGEKTVVGIDCSTLSSSYGESFLRILTGWVARQGNYHDSSDLIKVQI